MTRDTGWFREAAVGVRDSKNAGGPALNVRKKAWRAFLVPLDK